MCYSTMWYVRPAKSFCLSREYSTNIKLTTEHHLEFLSLKGGCTGTSDSTHVKMPPFWKSSKNPIIAAIPENAFFSSLVFEQVTGTVWRR